MVRPLTNDRRHEETINDWWNIYRCKKIVNKRSTFGFSSNQDHVEFTDDIFDTFTTCLSAI